VETSTFKQGVSYTQVRPSLKNADIAEEELQKPVPGGNTITSAGRNTLP